MNFYASERASGKYPSLAEWKYTPVAAATLEQLKEIENDWCTGRMSRSLYEAWFAPNSGDYVVVGGETCPALWAEALDELQPQTLDLPRVMAPLMDSLANTEPNGSRLRHLTRIRDGTGGWKHGMKYGPLSIYACRYHKALHLRVLHRPRWASRDCYAYINSLFPFSGAADKGATTIDVASLVHMFAQDDDTRRKLNLVFDILPLGSANVTVCAWIIYFMGVEMAPKLRSLLLYRRFCCVDSASYRKVCKAVSTCVRKTFTWVDGSPLNARQVAQLIGAELVIGRQNMVTDWAQERANRTTDEIPLRSPDPEVDPYDLLKQHLDDVYAVMLEGESCQKSWERHVEERAAWLAAGSSGGQFTHIDGEKVRLNKKAYFETLPLETVVAWIDSEPIIVARASEKYEMGKARAIYGTDSVDYVIISYLLRLVEPLMNKVEGFEIGLVGFNEVVSILRRLSEVRRGGRECSMFDYADFNLQHTHKAQSLVFQSLAEALDCDRFHPDYAKAARWAAAACLNQWVVWPGSEEKERAVQGMFSGVRSTNYMNTMLNKAYFLSACSHVEKLDGLRPVSLFVLHSGDDVWVSNGSRLWAMRMYKRLQDMNLKFQSSKQLFTVDAGEFLRIMYDKTGCYGLIWRALGSFIMRPLQSRQDRSPIENSVALNAHINLMCRRGLDMAFAKRLWDCTLPYHLKFRSKTHGLVTVPQHVAQKASWDGGLDIGPPGTSVSHSNATPRPPTYSLRSRKLEQHLPNFMTDDWVRLVSADVKRTFDSEMLRNMLKQAHMASSADDFDVRDCLEEYAGRLASWRRGSTPAGGGRMVVDWRQMCSDFLLLNRMIWCLSSGLMGVP